MSKFHYLNLNPKLRKTGDCVIRAIAGALGIPWKKASDMLYAMATSQYCEMSCIGCYSKLFDSLGFEEVDAEDMTVGELADRYSDDILIIRISGHLTFAKYGVVYDIWDCRDGRVDRAWIVL